MKKGDCIKFSATDFVLRLLTVWPWTLVLIVLFSLIVDDRLFEISLLIYFVLFLTIGLTAMVLSILNAQTTLPFKLAKENYQLKLIHIPMHLLLLGTIIADYIEALMATEAGGKEALLSTFLLILLVALPYFLCCIPVFVLTIVKASAYITYSKKHGILLPGAAKLHLLLHFIPFADLFSASYLYRQLKS